MRKSIAIMVSTAIFACSVISFSAKSDNELQGVQGMSYQDYYEVKSLNEDAALALAQIKSRADLDAYLKRAPLAISPLNKLSPASKERFINSITFNEGGITGFHYGGLESELTASEAYQILSLFGAQHTVRMMGNIRVESDIDEAIVLSLGPKGGPLCPTQPCDYEDRECSQRATCSVSLTDICMRTC